MNEELKARIPVQLPMSIMENEKARRFCIERGASLGRVCVIALMEYIARENAKGKK